MVHTWKRVRAVWQSTSSRYVQSGNRTHKAAFTHSSAIQSIDLLPLGARAPRRFPLKPSVPLAPRACTDRRLEQGAAMAASLLLHANSSGCAAAGHGLGAESSMPSTRHGERMRNIFTQPSASSRTGTASMPAGVCARVTMLPPRLWQHSHGAGKVPRTRPWRRRCCPACSIRAEQIQKCDA